MDEITKRKEAIKLFTQGISITRICQTLKQSRVWFYKWKSRYQSNPEGEWFVEQSRKPHNSKKNLILRSSPKLLQSGTN
ncbi:MAG: helix-turn-helix domain-containing protein [Ignavibacteriales bacterium]|nr:MAG: helix-turn-helix domain-containing protein [Ignavibacteriales bacterium]